MTRAENPTTPPPVEDGTAEAQRHDPQEGAASQAEQIGRLLERQNLLNWQHERTLSLLPVPALVTDGAGVIRFANDAVTTALSMRGKAVLGTPIFALFDASDRLALRGLLDRSDSTGVERAPATLVPRKGSLLPVDVTATARDDGARVSWLMLLRAEEPPVPAAVAYAVTRLGALPGHYRELQKVLSEAAELCHRSLGRPCELSINIGSPQEPGVVAATSQLAQAMDGAQWETGEGPSLAAYRQAEPVVSADLRRDGRWPVLAERVPGGLTSAVAAPIELEDRLVGTLNVYAEERHATEPLRDTVELLAATLGVVVHEVELGDELERLGADMQRALTSRAVIEQAKGVIMAQRRCSPDDAFAHLTELSSAQERKLRDVARDLVERAQR